MGMEYTRLHITPLTPDLLPSVLGVSPISNARNISYHAIETFPENSYGFVDLPQQAAQKLTKKLSGAILRGVKMKVEEARPKKRRHAEVETTASHAPVTRPASEEAKKKRKNSENILDGVELPSERKVKRGWTEPKKEKANKKSRENPERANSQYTDKEEMLFKTKVPPNRASTKKAKRSKRSAHNEVVHEFEKTVAQPSFLKQAGPEDRKNLHYVDGRGWVDDAGNVVEGETIQARRKRKNSVRAQEHEASRTSHPVKADDEPHSKPSSRKQEAEKDSLGGGAFQEQSEDATSDVAEPKSNQPTSASDREVHPLEALFKKPRKPASQDVAKPSLEITTSFSFFGNNHDDDDDDDDDDLEEDTSEPGTPYNSQELGSRGIRSAAPTPDTAYPSRFNSYSSLDMSEDDSLENGAGDADEISRQQSQNQAPGSPVQQSARSGPSEFERTFWEKRGENNRAWKERRRAVLKEKRKRENRARRPRNW